MDDVSLTEVLGGIVDADDDIIELEREITRRLLRHKRPRALSWAEPHVSSDVDLVLSDYRCTIVAVVGRTLETWKAAEGRETV